MLDNPGKYLLSKGECDKGEWTFRQSLIADVLNLDGNTHTIILTSYFRKKKMLIFIALVPSEIRLRVINSTLEFGEIGGPPRLTPLISLLCTHPDCDVLRLEEKTDK